ncbi:MAG: hypothetical protein Q4D77_01450 [Peptostreptococcaceae bacterium]|nr:hypothetical protein [Peptostreptococcaceae bacterium]
MKRYCLNDEIVSYLNKKSRSEAILLIVLVLFMLLNILLYHKERKLEKLYESLQASAQSDQLTDEYLSVKEESVLLGKASMKKYFEILDLVQAEGIVFQEDSLMLIYNDRSVHEIEEELAAFQKEMDVEIVQINETQDAKKIYVEVHR